MIKELVQNYGENSWDIIACEMKTRTPRQLKERYNKFLSPNVTTAPWSREEDELLMEKFAVFGNRWTKIAKFFKGRTDLACRNRIKALIKRTEKDASSRKLVLPPLSLDDGGMAKPIRITDFLDQEAAETSECGIFTNNL